MTNFLTLTKYLKYAYFNTFFYYKAFDGFYLAHSSLQLGIFQNIKTAIKKPLLQQHNLDASIRSNNRPMSNLPFIEKIIKRAVHHLHHRHLHLLFIMTLITHFFNRISVVLLFVQPCFERQLFLKVAIIKCIIMSKEKKTPYFSIYHCDGIHEGDQKNCGKILIVVTVFHRSLPLLEKLIKTRWSAT